ncbi:unnamed protein product [Urochloa humidicola]
MDDLRAAGLDAARKRVTPAPGTAAAAADARAWRSSGPTQLLGTADRRGTLPPRRGGGGGGAKRDPGEAGDGAREARHGGVCGKGKAEEKAVGGSGRGTSRGGGGGAARSGAVVPRAGPRAEAGGNARAEDVPDGGAVRVVAAPRGGLSGVGEAGSKMRALASSAAPREGTGSGEVGRKKRAFASVDSLRAYPPPKRTMVSAERSFPARCGRGDDSSRLVAAPAPPGGGSAASPKKPATQGRSHRGGAQGPGPP